MIAMVGYRATALPWPPLPPIAFIAEHEYDPWNRGSTFQLQSVVTPAVNVLEQNRFMERVGTGVLIVLGLFIAYGALRGIGTVAVQVARDRRYFPHFGVVLQLARRFSIAQFACRSCRVWTVRLHIEEPFAVGENGEPAR